MDGTNIAIVHRLYYFADPYSLILDDVNNVLYWVDDDDYRLKYFNLSSPSNRTQILDINNVNKPYELTIYGNDLYWTANDFGSTAGLFRAPLSGPNRHRVVQAASDFITPTGVASVSGSEVNSKSHPSPS